MIILFSKKQSPSKHVIKYIREGKPDHWIYADDFLILHDLSHYAIEKTLHYDSAFWGLVKQGIDPAIFEDKVKRDQLQLADEAWYAEHMANLILMEFSQGAFENFQAVLESTISQNQPTLPLPQISNEVLDEIRRNYKKWVEVWRALPPNEHLLLEF